ncbi:MAG TPA: hypothetical protein PKE40_09250 [Arachnia sp.]|nr:hypothetical protein [Arachnia sp.]HMT86525.1 hypothetical protein [Arachnia sp.]
MKLLATLLAMSGAAWVVVLGAASASPYVLLVAAYVAVAYVLVRRTPRTAGLFSRLGTLAAVGAVIMGSVLVLPLTGSGGAGSAGEAIAAIVAVLIWGSAAVALWLVPALIAWSFIRDGRPAGLR